METSYDVVVIGAGPAGLSAATQAAQAGLRTLCLDKLAPGGALINLTHLHNVEDAADGPTIAARLSDAATEAGVELGFGEVTQLSGSAPWAVETAEGERHTARAVVIASGLAKGRLGVDGEEDYEGRGVSHCASCDGPLYAGQPVVVVGAANWGWQEAEELKSFTDDVTVVDPAPPTGTGGMRCIAGRIVALEGSNGLESVVVETDGARKILPASGAFVYVGRAPAAEFVPDSLARDASGHIVVDDEGRTSVASAFAVGDIRLGARQSLAEAIADGERAGRAIAKALGES
ncbi:MAG: FAD-dependent oxidoreductase [Alphaproteobacteria bacterium]|nr:FAD-dependent oxidoreductase [Alphaproteobacteria bacterium]